MVRQFKLIRAMLVLTGILSIIEIIFLCIKPETRQIILSIVVFLGFITNVVFFIILKKEVNKIIFECEEEYTIRLIDEDDYQHVRILLDSSPLENTQEEYSKLKEYQKITIDFTRINYHYIVFKGEDLVCIFYALTSGKEVFVEFKNKFNDVENVKVILMDLASKNHFEIKF